MPEWIELHPDTGADEPTFRGDPAELVEAAGDVLDLLQLARSPMARGAACRDRPDVSWFPERGEPAGPAKAICAVCGVRERCLAYAIDHGIVYGVWGGLSPKERRQLRRAA